MGIRRLSILLLFVLLVLTAPAFNQFLPADDLIEELVGTVDISPARRCP